MTQSSVLIVDDELLGRTMLEGLLRPCGYRLLAASSGIEALAMAIEARPDVVLLDVMMPGMNGFAVCKELRANPETAEIPIVLVTALDDYESRLEGISAGADDFISKPFDRAELRMRIQTITRLNRYRELVRMREQFMWVVEQALEGYVLLDTDGQMKYANPQARRYLNLPKDPHAPLTMTFLQAARLMYQCEPAAVWEDWSSAVASDVARYLVLAETPGTAAFWLQVEMLTLPENLAYGQLVRLRDVTAQMALRRDMSSFHSMLTHKLRTPLIGLVTSAELLEMHADNLPREQIAEIGQIAGKSFRRLRDQVDDIMQYIYLPGSASVQGAMCVDELQDIVVGLAPALMPATLSVSCQPNINKQWIGLSKRAMELVLWELCENSKKFHPSSKPDIDIVVMQGTQNSLIVQVRDNGITLTPQQLMQILTPYYQSEKSFTGQVPGMGLGLSLVATLVWSIGGTCIMENRADRQGVIATLTLPRYHARPDQIQARIQRATGAAAP